MADPLTMINEFLGGLQLSFGNPIGLATNLVLSTIVGGIIILVIIEVLAKKFSEEVNPTRPFLLVLAVSVINLIGIIPLLGGFLISLPLVGILVLILPILVWIVLVKLFFSDMEMLHILIISVICYFVSIYIIPMAVAMVYPFIPI